MGSLHSLRSKCYSSPCVGYCRPGILEHTRMVFPEKLYVCLSSDIKPSRLHGLAPCRYACSFRLSCFFSYYLIIYLYFCLFVYLSFPLFPSSPRLANNLPGSVNERERGSAKLLCYFAPPLPFHISFILPLFFFFFFGIYFSFPFISTTDCVFISFSNIPSPFERFFPSVNSFHSGRRQPIRHLEVPNHAHIIHTTKR